MHRNALTYLDTWLQGSARLPLIIRGARQVGKTWLVRTFAHRCGRTLVELNLERDPDFARFFATSDPRRVVRSIEARTGQRVSAADSLLFLDEIQAAPETLARLRWFAEEMPELPILAAGSLLDFVLADHSFAMPVGRVTYFHLEPMSFQEFLAATGEEGLVSYLETFTIEPEPDPMHAHLLELYRDYLLVGGMPAAVRSWAVERSPVACARIHQDLLATYRDDFAKYAGRIPPPRLTRVLDAVPRMLGRSFTYAQVDRQERSTALRRALDLLCMARLCSKVQACDGAGVPLAAGVRERPFKVILLDVGLASASLGLAMGGVPSLRDLYLVNEGALAEQAIGQALRQLEPGFVPPSLFYWSREHRGSAAELDYLVQHAGTVIPIEVKAGTTGTLKSLHLFMALRGLELGIRFSPHPASLAPVEVKTTTGETARYHLLSLPPYLAEQLQRMLDDLGHAPAWTTNDAHR